MSNGIARVQPATVLNTGTTHAAMDYKADCSFGQCNMQTTIVGDKLKINVNLAQTGNNRQRTDGYNNEVQVC